MDTIKDPDAFITQLLQGEELHLSKIISSCDQNKIIYEKSTFCDINEKSINFYIVFKLLIQNKNYKFAIIKESPDIHKQWDAGYADRDWHVVEKKHAIILLRKKKVCLRNIIEICENFDIELRTFAKAKNVNGVWCFFVKFTLIANAYFKYSLKLTELSYAWTWWDDVYSSHNWEAVE